MTHYGYDRVRNNTPAWMNLRIDEKTEKNVRTYQQRSHHDIAWRIAKLDREWDIERVLQLQASIVALTGLVLGVTRNRKWLGIPAVVLPFLLQHSVQGWCPPIPILRALGFRTRQEIDDEKYALLCEIA